MMCRCGECSDLVITNKVVSDYIQEAAKRFDVSFIQAATTFQNIVTCLADIPVYENELYILGHFETEVNT